jgi:hypothetical protein
MKENKFNIENFPPDVIVKNNKLDVIQTKYKDAIDPNGQFIPEDFARSILADVIHTLRPPYDQLLFPERYPDGEIRNQVQKEQLMKVLDHFDVHDMYRP